MYYFEIPSIGQFKLITLAQSFYILKETEWQKFLNIEIHMSYAIKSRIFELSVIEKYSGFSNHRLGWQIIEAFYTSILYSIILMRVLQFCWRRSTPSLEPRPCTERKVILIKAVVKMYLFLNCGTQHTCWPTNIIRHQRLYDLIVKCCEIRIRPIETTQRTQTKAGTESWMHRKVSDTQIVYQRCRLKNKCLHLTISRESFYSRITNRYKSNIC